MGAANTHDAVGANNYSPLRGNADATHDANTGPVQFAEQILGVTLWSKQREVLEALANNRRVAVKSGNGLGKDFLAAVAVLWFLRCHDPAIVLTTAPTFRQVRNVLWRQIHRLHEPVADTLGGKMLNTRWEISPDRYALGLSAGGADRFQGFHCENILVVVDEAAGVNEDIYEAVEAVMTSHNAKLLLIGNPTTTDGAFHRAFHQERGLYQTVTISALESPNLTGDEPPVPGLVTAEWVAERKTAWSENSDRYRSRVLGEFPARGDDTLFSMDDIEAAIYDDAIQDDAAIYDDAIQDAAAIYDDAPAPAIHAGDAGPLLPGARQCDAAAAHGDAEANNHSTRRAATLDRHYDALLPATHAGDAAALLVGSRQCGTTADHNGAGAHSYSPRRAAPPRHGDPFGMFLPGVSLPAGDGRLVVGVDVARFGNDRSVVLTRRGNRVESIRAFSRIDTMATAGQVMVAARAGRPDAVNVDAIGVGAGLADRLREQGVPARDVNVSEKPRRDRMCANLRAEGYQALARRFRNRRIRIPRDPDLISELASLRYLYDSKGRLLVEPKDSIRRRGQRSPDKADALMLAFLDDRGESSQSAFPGLWD